MIDKPIVLTIRLTYSQALAIVRQLIDRIEYKQITKQPNYTNENPRY